MGLIEPKTNWTADDRFNITDYNRIKNNLVYVYNRSLECYARFDIEDMGANITGYSGFWDVNRFNQIERNLEHINNRTYMQNMGTTRTFFENGPFISWDELNRIENGTKTLNEALDRVLNARRRIPFRLGNYRGIRI